MLEGYEEHHVVDLLMGELERLRRDETWGAKAKVMKENIEHHIEEEEGEMFKAARQSSIARSSRTSATDGRAQGIRRSRSSTSPDPGWWPRRAELLTEPAVIPSTIWRLNTKKMTIIGIVTIDSALNSSA